MLKEKIKELRSNIQEKRADLNKQIEDAKAKAEAGDMDAAKAIKEAIDALNKEIEELEEQLENLEDIDALEPKEDEQSPAAPPSKDSSKGETRSMHKKLMNKTDEELRSFENYIRSRGEYRDGLTTENTSVVVPKEVVTNVLELKDDEFDLANYVTSETVGSKYGSFPVVRRKAGRLMTKEQLAEMGEVTTNPFIDVEWDVETYAGMIPLSNELIEDSAIDIVAKVQSYLQRTVRETNNYAIIEILKSFKAVNANSLDELKRVHNVELKASMKKSAVMNQSAYNMLDTLKDENGRYLLQDSISAPSGKTLFGAEVIVVDDELLPNGGTEAAPTYPIFMGDLKESVFVAKRNQISVEWEKFDRYSTGLAVVLRADYKQIDPDAGRFVHFAPEVVASPEQPAA